MEYSPRIEEPESESSLANSSASIECTSPETAVKAATVAIEDPETHKITEIGPTEPPRHYSKTGTLMSKAAANISTTVAKNFLSQAPMLATSVGQSVLSGSMAAVVGAVDVARSNNKKRSIARVLPTVGLALIPGIGLPLAIGLGVASSYTADKVYVNASKGDRKLELEQFWPPKYEFTMLKEGFLQAWVNVFAEIAETFCHCTPKYNDKAQEVIEVILWLLESLIKLKHDLLVNWHWEDTSIAVFDKNIKQISKGLKVSSIEIKEISKVIKEGTENFIKNVRPCAKKTDEKTQAFQMSLQTLEGYILFLDNVRDGMIDAIKEARKYLEHEQKRLN